MPYSSSAIQGRPPTGLNERAYLAGEVSSRAFIAPEQGFLRTRASLSSVANQKKFPNTRSRLLRVIRSAYHVLSLKILRSSQIKSTWKMAASVVFLAGFAAGLTVLCMGFPWWLAVVPVLGGMLGVQGIGRVSKHISQTTECEERIVGRFREDSGSTYNSSLDSSFTLPQQIDAKQELRSPFDQMDSEEQFTSLNRVRRGRALSVDVDDEREIENVYAFEDFLATLILENANTLSSNPVFAWVQSVINAENTFDVRNRAGSFDVDDWREYQDVRTFEKLVVNHIVSRNGYRSSEYDIDEMRQFDTE